VSLLARIYRFGGLAPYPKTDIMNADGEAVALCSVAFISQPTGF
jgi:hypothetical protein